MSKVIELKSDRPVYTLSIASHLSNIPAHSIRQYIDKGLILPFKLDSNRHLFSPGDIDRLKNIHILIQERGLNFAGIRALMAMIPCWAVRDCSKNDRESCNAYTSDFEPCWEASEKGRVCRNENCRECKVYRGLSEQHELKAVLRTLF